MSESMAILILYLDLPSFPDRIRSSAVFYFMPSVPGTSTDYDLSADGKRHQLFQFDGCAILHHHGLSDGQRRYL